MHTNYGAISRKDDEPYDGEGEWVAERAEAISTEMVNNEERVSEALDNACGFTDYSDQFTKDLARFFVAFDAAKGNESCAEAALTLFRSIEPHVMAYVESDARTRAQAEYDSSRYAPDDH